MRRQFKYFAAAASLLTLMTACTADKLEAYYGQPNPNPETPDNAISFGTYMGKTGTTRAGYQGSINTTELQKTGNGTANGFGVFAYYTGKDTYGSYQHDTYTGESARVTAAAQGTNPNFMYNQYVHYDNTSGYISNWTYSPIKYWPNEISPAESDGRVDDQDDDQAANPATSETNNGGYVSFFAYAPYVYVNVTGDDANLGKPTSSKDNYGTGETDGIVAISKNTDGGDPKITYVVATGSGNLKQVDLLWGTRSGTKEIATQEGGNDGVTGSSTASAKTYQKAIYDATNVAYNLNADLTKQKTTGVVGFDFKHALAKVGGSTGNGVTPDVGSTQYGLLAVLDLDDLKGNETGGFYTPDGREGTAGGQTTKVTIKEISIEAYSKVPTAFDGSGNPTEWKYLKQNQGVFNLATGNWDILKTVTTENDNLLDNDGSGTAETTDDAAKVTHVINTTGTDASASLASSIAEPTGGISEGTTAWDGLVEGVTLTPKNVYGTEANPLVFIPGTSAELYVTCDYVVRTKDENLAKGYSEVHQKIKKKVTFTKVLQLNKMYSLLMHIGLTGIKFTATVSNWDVNNDDSNFNSNPDVDNDNDIHVDDVYVPMNVSELQSVSCETSETIFGSFGGTIRLDNLNLVYSDPTDNIPYTSKEYTVDHQDDFESDGTAKFTKLPYNKFKDYGITFTTSGGTITGEGTANSPYILSIPSNETAKSTTYTITVHRGNQTGSFIITQERGTVESVTLTVTPTTLAANAESGYVTPTANATFNHTGVGYSANSGVANTESTETSGAISYSHSVTNTIDYGTTYTVDGVETSLTENLSLPITRTVTRAHTVKASLKTESGEKGSRTPTTKESAVSNVYVTVASADVSSNVPQTVYANSTATSFTIHFTPASGYALSTAVASDSKTTSISGNDVTVEIGEGSGTTTVTLTEKKDEKSDITTAVIIIQP